MKRIKKLISSLLVAVIILTAAPLSGFVGLYIDFGWLGIDTKASAADTELAPTGQCGENVYWTFDKDTGLLTISGSGRMYRYGFYGGESPFYCNQSIKNIVIKNGLTSVSDFAFHGCKGLTSITIPDSITSIDDGAFFGCTGLTNITIPDSVTSIGDSAFYECTSLTNIAIPENVTSIGSSSFRFCSGLTSITIPNSVTRIGNFAFSGCTGLTNITIPDSITSIGYNAFSDCTGLTSIIISNGVTSISSWAFSGCTSLTSITIPDSVTSIGSSVFYNTGYYNNTNNWENNVLYIGNYLIDVNDKISGLYTIRSGTKTIADNAFCGCTGLTSIIIPDSVTSIGDYAFRDCTGLIELTMPCSVKIYNSQYTFYNCSNIEKVTLTKGTGTMQDYGTSSSSSSSTTYYKYTPWYISSSIKEIIIEDGVTNIGEYSFYGCTGLKNITISDSVTSLGSYAFYGCTSLTSVTIGKNVTGIGSYAFYGCTGLTSITIPESVTSIGDGAFDSCPNIKRMEYNAINAEITISWIDRSIKEVIIGESVEIIPEDMLYDCDQITSLTFPANVKEIRNYAFGNCDNLETITFLGDGKIDFGTNVFAYGNKLKIVCKENSFIHNYAEANGLNYCIIDDSSNSFDLKNDILMGYNGNSKDLFISCASKIGFAAFENNQSVETIEFASNVERIFNKAFANCSNLSKVIIPQSVASIGDNAFEGCDKLTIWCYAGTYAEAYAIGHGIPVRYITLQLNESELELKANESVNLCASFNTDLNDICEIIWTSDKPSVVSVTGDGKITAVGKGKATVTATSSTGLSTTCVVNVVSDEPQEKPKVNSVKIDDISLNYKKSKTINPQIDADEGAKYTVTYSSSNNKVATVDENGKVTATKRGSGSATITCTVTDEYGNTATDTCTVKVSLNFGQILLVYVLFGWIWY